MSSTMRFAKPKSERGGDPHAGRDSDSDNTAKRLPSLIRDVQRMLRRKFLITTASLVGLAGCPSTEGGSGQQEPATSSPTPSGGSRSTPTATPAQVNRDSLSMAESVTIESLNVSVTDAAVNRRISGPDWERIRDDGLFVLIRVSVKNTGDQEVRPPMASDFSLLSGTSQFEPDMLFPDSIEGPVTGSSYEPPSKILPDVEKSGWLVYEVPPDFQELSVGLSFFSAVTGEDHGPIYWGLPLSPEDAAILSIDSVSTPDSIEYGETAVFKISISNSGGRPGEISRQYYLSTPDSSVLRAELLTATVPPGDTVVKEITYTPTRMQPIEFEFDGTTYTTSVDPASLSLGDEWETPTDIVIGLSDLRFTESVQVKGESRKREPINADKYAILRCHRKNESQTERVLPEIRLQSERSSSSPAAGSLGEDPEFVDPVSGTWLSHPAFIDGGAQATGWLLFPVDSSVKRSKTTIQVLSRQTVVASWSS